MFGPTNVARFIELERKAQRASVRSSSKSAGISEGRWRQIAKGYQQVTKDVKAPVNAPVETLGRMATAVGIKADRLRKFPYTDDNESILGNAVADWLAAREPVRRNGPAFPGSYEDPDYLENIENWASELEERVEELEQRLSKLESEPDYTKMGDPSEYGLAASKGEPHIAPDELPHET
ncbi:hypothetical protein [Zhihengliuella halotolerans]|uniref:hypothetical protein n=1 Tax=Zhihengliuella halotolerans TaxID=370736 RepID=UPI0011AECF64|nr:hypothetical protein [Zhihengliuella halotolerans]